MPGTSATSPNRRLGPLRGSPKYKTALRSSPGPMNAQSLSGPISTERRLQWLRFLWKRRRPFRPLQTEVDRLFDRFAAGLRLPSWRHMFEMEPIGLGGSFTFPTPAVEVT